MKPISVHVSEDSYQRLKVLAAREGRPVAALIRDAMERYLLDSRQPLASILDLTPHDSGPLREGWTRESLYDEMTSR